MQEDDLVYGVDFIVLGKYTLMLCWWYSLHSGTH